MIIYQSTIQSLVTKLLMHEPHIPTLAARIGISQFTLKRILKRKNISFNTAQKVLFFCTHFSPTKKRCERTYH